MASPHGQTYFLTFNGKKYHPSLECNDKEGLLQDPIHHAPDSSKRDFKVSFFLFLLFFWGKFVDSMFCGELYDEALSFCCCLLLWGFWDIVWFGGESLYDRIDFFRDIFELLSCLRLWSLDNVDGLWNFVLHVACGLVGWILILFLCGYEIMRIWWVGIIFMGMEIFWVLFSWVWKFICVGHMFE